MSKPAKITLRSGRDRAQAARWLDKCPLGYTLLFKPPVRSNPQNARLWAFLDDIAAQKEWAGKKRDSESWKALFLAALRGQELVPNIDGNGFVALHMRSSELSPEEFSDLLQLIEAWGAQNEVVFSDQPDSSPSQAGDETRAGLVADGYARAEGSAREDMGAGK